MESLLFPLLLAGLLAFMFLGMRRQKKEADKVTQMQNNLQVGDRVTTTSGLYGTVVDVDDTTVDLEIAEDVVTTWLRLAIREVRTDDDLAAESADAEPAGETTDAPADETAAPAAEETPKQTETRLTKD
ncbi:preprotein translocase subunit YajC [Nocardia carnea]|uniref:preprotein translocase subunit YajC n=1 Tax=Nocardia carnea TaxID=37328 RepID=UPI002453B2D0|nr:preprotein translocase subunit YajC [Nocardia carnea]